MPQPHDAYLAYLIALDMDDNEIVRLLEMDNLVVPEPAERARLRFKLADRPERPWDDSNPSASHWAMYYGVNDVFDGSPHADAAFKILRSTVNRFPVEALLLGGMESEAIVEFAQEHELVGITEDGVTCFERVFWSIRRLSVAEWRQFLDRHPMGDVYVKVLSGGESAAKDIADVFLKRLPVEDKIGVDPARFNEFMKGVRVTSGEDGECHVPPPVGSGG